MKNFEKWWTNATADYVSESEVKQDGIVAAAAWRAALEMVYNHRWFDDSYMLAKSLDKELETK